MYAGFWFCPLRREAVEIATFSIRSGPTHAGLTDRVLGFAVKHDCVMGMVGLPEIQSISSGAAGRSRYDMQKQELNYDKSISKRCRNRRKGGAWKN